MTAFLFTGGRVLDPSCTHLLEGIDVLVEDDRIKEVSDRPLSSPSATRVDLRGRTLMPGLIDCHVHVVSWSVDMWTNALAPTSLTALKAARILNTALMNGFTTLRDLGGADYGLVLALKEGLIEGPRLVICGKGLSQTGGHSDIRGRTDDRTSIMSNRLGGMGVLCDGVDGVRSAAREQLRTGAQFVKIMANGGVASPTDPIHALQFSRDELRAVVEEATNAGTYVAAHVYTDAAIRRAVECGVHSLEHCNLIEGDTAALAAAAGAIAVPTLVAYEGLALDGEKFGLGPEAVAKIETVRRGGFQSLAVMREAGLPMAFGSDLLGELQRYHGMEFELLARVLSPPEILRSATTVGARLCHLEGQIGVVAQGAYADLLVVDGDPTTDVTVLADDATHIDAIMSAGRFVKPPRER